MYSLLADFKNSSYCNFESFKPTAEIYFIPQSLSKSLLNFKEHSSLFSTISAREGEAELQIILYLKGLLSCSFSIGFLIIITQPCLNLVFNSLETCEFCNANFVAVPRLRLTIIKKLILICKVLLLCLIPPPVF